MKEVPSWYNEESECILNRGYFLRGEDINSAIDRITTHASNKLGRSDLKEKFREMIFKGWVSFSSPVWSNMGTTRGLSISCFGSVVGDSMEEIADKLSENIILTKSGGGTSSYFGKLRPRGASISMNGESSGPISFMHMFDTMILNVAQGSVRRGSHACYLDIDHPDIEEFLKIKEIGNPLQSLFTGVCVPDYWMESMIDGDREKRNIWAKVLKSRKEKGIPYIFFTDNVNKDKPQIFKDRKLKIHASNLCSLWT